MPIRFLVILFWLIIAGTPAHAIDRLPRPPSNSNATLFIPIQNRAEQPEAWRSPVKSLDQFPYLGPSDCARYGSDYGYPECIQAGADRGGQTQADADPAAGATGWAVNEAVVESATTPAKDETLRAMIGPLLILGFEGRSAADEGPQRLAGMLKSGAAGGALIRGGNIESPEQLRALVAALSNGSEPPPIIMTESPGGADNGLPPDRGFKAFPSPSEIVASGDALAAFNGYRSMAANLATLGVTMNLGPSAQTCPQDETADKLVCFGSVPQPAAAFATAFNFAHRGQGVLTGMRYRPVADDRASLEMLGEMMKQKAPDALVIEFSGVGPAKLDTAAKTIAVLRDAGFSGAVIFDVSGKLSAASAGNTVVQALRSGADLILLREDAGTLSDPITAAVQAALEAGRLSELRIRDAGEKAAALRTWLENPASRVLSEGISIRKNSIR